MGFYIEELPTELNGITMQEADCLADEFLKDTHCNRMWDAMRALRDFYETVISEAVEVVDRKTEPNAIQHVQHVESVKDETGRWVRVGQWEWEHHTDSTHFGKAKGESVTSNKVETEPQTDYTPDCPFCKRYGTEDCLGSDCRHYKTYKTEPSGYNLKPVEDEPQTCEECEHWSDTEDGCADRHGCKTEPQTETKTETQNSNLTFEKADERCKGCNHYKLTCDLFSEICRYEPKDEPQTDCTNCDQVGRCERGKAVDCPLTERSE